MQKRPSTTSETSAVAGRARRPAASSAANGVRTTRGDRQRRAHRGARVEVGELALEDHRPDRVAEGRDQDRASAEQLVGAPGDVDADERDHAAEPDQQPDQPRARHALVGVEAQRQQRDEQRRGGDDDRRQRRVDVLLAGGDQRERDGDLDHRVDGEPAPAAAQRRQHAGPPGQREQHAAPSTTRTHARKAGGTPSSTATLMNRYGIPQSVETAAKAAHARALTDGR